MPKTTETEVEKKSYGPANYHSWLYGALAVVILVIVFLAVAAVARHHCNGGPGKRFFTGMYGPIGGPGAGFMHRGGRQLGGSVTVNGQTRAEGVVTTVDGSSFTIAGDGSTTNVTTNSSTQYQNGNQVKQNDTVVVFGTTSNNTMSATRIDINP